MTVYFILRYIGFTPIIIHLAEIWHNIGAIPHNIGTVMLLRRKYIHAMITMLKAIPKTERCNAHTFYKGVFCCKRGGNAEKNSTLQPLPGAVFLSDE